MSLPLVENMDDVRDALIWFVINTQADAINIQSNTYRITSETPFNVSDETIPVNEFMDNVNDGKYDHIFGENFPTYIPYVDGSITVFRFFDPPSFKFTPVRYI